MITLSCSLVSYLTCGIWALLYDSKELAPPTFPGVLKTRDMSLSEALVISARSWLSCVCEQKSALCLPFLLCCLAPVGKWVLRFAHRVKLGKSIASD